MLGAVWIVFPVDEVLAPALFENTSDGPVFLVLFFLNKLILLAGRWDLVLGGRWDLILGRRRNLILIGQQNLIPVHRFKILRVRRWFCARSHSSFSTLGRLLDRITGALPLRRHYARLVGARSLEKQVVRVMIERENCDAKGEGKGKDELPAMEIPLRVDSNSQRYVGRLTSVKLWRSWGIIRR